MRFVVSPLCMDVCFAACAFCFSVSASVLFRFFLKYLLYAVLGEMYYCFYICDGDVFIIVERGGRC